MFDPLEAIKNKFSGRIINFQESSPKRIYIEFAPVDIPKVAEFAVKELNLRFSTASAVDVVKGFEILYFFSQDSSGKVITLRTLIADKDNPEIESIAGVVKGAEWIEREMWELFGINFKGHPNLKRLLLADDWPEGKFPLRKK
jgi:Ni,Fe-hydrogenase III component G